MFDVWQKTGAGTCQYAVVYHRIPPGTRKRWLNLLNHKIEFM